MKPLYLTEEMKRKARKAFDSKVKELKKEFERCLKNGEIDNNSISIKTEISINGNNSKPASKAIVVFTPEVYCKIKKTVDFFKKEFAWNCLVKRDETVENKFIVYDFIVFEQTVSAATTTTEDEQYGAFLDTLTDDQLNNLRFHGHSHVNMGVTPSGVDMNYRAGIVKGTPKNSFFIFAIVNKKGDMSMEIYDKKNNMLYGTSDINIDIDCSGKTMSDYLKECDAKVKEKTYFNYTTSDHPEYNYEFSDEPDSDEQFDWFSERKKIQDLFEGID